MDTAWVIEKNENANIKRAYIIMATVHWRLNSDGRKVNGELELVEREFVRLPLSYSLLVRFEMDNSSFGRRRATLGRHCI